ACADDVTSASRTSLRADDTGAIRRARAATGWSYWFTWVVTGMAELTAIGVYVGYWLPALPQWITVLAALVVLYGANMLAVRVFGGMEVWFALIKVAMIVMLIVGGLIVILFRVGDLRAAAGFSNLWSHGGLLPFGILGVLLTFQMVMFGFQGVELIGVTAGEAENPEVVLPRATNSIAGPLESDRPRDEPVRPRL